MCLLQNVEDGPFSQVHLKKKEFQTALRFEQTKEKKNSHT